MGKQTKTLFKRKCYLLGKDKDGINYWLEAPIWSCDWYWGFGYVETYENNNHPELSRDINSHSHFDSMFLNGPECARDMFKNFFAETPLTDAEIYELTDYMLTFYTLQSAAELFKHGYSYQTSRALIDNLKNKDQNDLINKTLLPELFKRVETLLTE